MNGNVTVETRRDPPILILWFRRGALQFTSVGHICLSRRERRTYSDPLRLDLCLVQCSPLIIYLTACKSRSLPRPFFIGFVVVAKKRRKRRLKFFFRFCALVRWVIRGRPSYGGRGAMMLHRNFRGRGKIRGQLINIRKFGQLIISWKSLKLLPPDITF